MSDGKSTRPKAQSVRVQSADIVPANAVGEEGILLDKEHTTKVHPVITNEVRNSTPSDQDLIDASKDDSSSRPVEDGHVGYEVEYNLKVKGKPSKTLPLGRDFSTRRLKSCSAEGPIYNFQSRSKPTFGGAREIC